MKFRDTGRAKDKFDVCTIHNEPTMLCFGCIPFINIPTETFTILSSKNIELLYDLDGSEGGIALNLFQLLLKEQTTNSQASSSSSSRYESRLYVA